MIGVVIVRLEEGEEMMGECDLVSSRIVEWYIYHKL
jgi:hypothetical protein